MTGSFCVFVEFKPFLMLAVESDAGETLVFAGVWSWNRISALMQGLMAMAVILCS